MNPHLTSDDLLNRLYGLGEAEGESGKHLLDCQECAARLRGFKVRQTEAVAASGAAVEVSNEFLASQRRQVYARLEEPAAFHGRWAPAALAAGFLLAAGLFLYHPAPQKIAHQAPAHPVAAQRAELTDDQLFSNIYSLEESVEPRAAAPIRALFEGDEPGGEQ
jgi:hypothetical protein